MKGSWHAARVFLYVVLLLGSGMGYKCRNEQGQEVDWFVAFRHPQSRHYSIFQVGDTELRYLFDETLMHKLFNGIDLTKDKVLLWNDEPATPESNSANEDDPNTETAHDKGVLYRSQHDNTGFYLLHSIPKYPAVVGNSSLDPVTPISSTYGQSMICISMSDDASFGTVWQHVSAQYSQIYYNSFDYNPPPKTTVQVIDTNNFQGLFRYITKTVINLNPPYEGMLAPMLKSSLLVESWGRPYAPNNCTGPYQVINSVTATFGRETFNSTDDHSKYMVSLTQVGLLCVGGMNHMTSQAYRGGSFMCFTNAWLYQALRYSVLNPGPGCPKSLHKPLNPLTPSEDGGVDSIPTEEPSVPEIPFHII